MAEPASELARLKALLLRPESSQLERLQERVGALDERLGTRERLEQATTEILVDAFRAAESRQHSELARAVAPVVVAAIQSEIRNSRDMMVEALYPITGRLVAAAVADAFRSLVAAINHRVDTMMSLRLWRLRLRAWTTRRPFGELLLAEAARPRLRRLLFLERGSGSLLASWSDEPAAEDRADLISGMLAAITEFSSTVMERQAGQLRTIDMGASRILLHVSARAIVAGEFVGPLTPKDEAFVHEAFATAAERHHDERATNDDSLRDVALGLVGGLADMPQEKNKPRSYGVWILVLLLAAGAAYFGWNAWTRASFETNVRVALAREIAARPQMSAFPVTLNLDHQTGKARLAGLVPSSEDAQALRAAVAAAAAPYETLDEITVIATQDTTARALALMREQLAAMQSQIESNLQSQTTGQRNAIASQGQALARLGAELAQIHRLLQTHMASAGEIAKKIDEIAADLNARLQALQAQAGEPRAAVEKFTRRHAIFFEQGATLRDKPGAEAIVKELAGLLRTANMPIRLVAYSSESGSLALNRRLAQERADVVAAMLAEYGVDANRIVRAIRAANNSIDDSPDAPGHANRRVEFETVFENEKAAP